MKIPPALMLTMAIAAFGQANPQHRIDSLKSAPVSAIEPGMTAVKFGEWFAGIVRPAQAKYEIKDCEASDATGPEKPVCVQAGAELSNGRTVEIVFKIGPSADNNDARTEKRAKIELISGQLRPTNPMSKQPSRVVRKLSDLEALVK